MGQSRRETVDRMSRLDDAHHLLYVDADVVARCCRFGGTERYRSEIERVEVRLGHLFQSRSYSRKSVALLGGVAEGTAERSWSCRFTVIRLLNEEKCLESITRFSLLVTSIGVK